MSTVAATIPAALVVMRVLNIEIRSRRCAVSRRRTEEEY
jgi:hypothetical protein